jgi:acetylornithine/succinyldiaminopimelate/putrescine aminotransferase
MSVASGAETGTYAQTIVDLEKQYLLQNYSRHPLVLHRGDGPYMWDVDGKRYLDFIAGIGVNALGQNHPRIVAAIAEQAARLIHTSNLFYNEYQGPLAKRIAEVSGLARTFFTNSGTVTISALTNTRSSRSIIPSTAAALARFPSPVNLNTVRILSPSCRE